MERFLCFPFIPRQEAAGQRYSWVGCRTGSAVTAFHDAADRDGAPLQQGQEGVMEGAGKGQAQAEPGLSRQPAPPLALTGARQVRPPAAVVVPVRNGLADDADRRLKPAPMQPGPQAMNTAAVWAEEPAEQDGRGEAGKIGGNKAMPPEPLTAVGATGRLFPGKIFAERS